MAWTNVFDRGDCEIQLYRWPDNTPILVPESEWAGLGVTISVVDGVVTVTANDLNVLLSVYVKPNFETNSSPVRITSLTADFGAGSGDIRFNAYRDVDAAGQDPNAAIGLSSSNPVEPDPATYPGKPWQVAGIEFQRVET